MHVLIQHHRQNMEEPYTSVFTNAEVYVVAFQNFWRDSEQWQQIHLTVTVESKNAQIRHANIRT